MSHHQRASSTPVECEVVTVRGPISANDLGMTLTHEHLVSDWTRARTKLSAEKDRKLLNAQVEASMRWLLTEDPGCCVDNLRQDDGDAMVEELANFVQAGGQTVVDCSNGDMGRDPLALVRISEASGVNVVMGSGWYVHSYHPASRLGATVEDLYQDLLEEFAAGVGSTGVRPGVIGEIGVSPLFTESEKTHLRAAARAQRTLGVPLYIHLPGWQRRAFEVLEIVLQEEGADAAGVVLCHMDPSGEDFDYQRSVAACGVWLEFDMIGMQVYYEGEGQSPAPAQTAAAIACLIDDGWANRVLLSHDLALKSMWARHGGSGLGYVPRLFLPRLHRHGVSPDVTASLMTTNPRELFVSAQRGWRG